MTADDELRNLFSLSVDLMCVADSEGKLQRVNPAFTRVLGWSEKELIGVSYEYFVHPEDTDATKEEVEGLNAGEITYSFVNRWRCANDKYKWLSWNARAGTGGKLYCVARDVTKQKLYDQKERERYERLVRIDPLTDLLNRRGLEGALTRFNKEVHVILIDLDDFKNINTQCGHAMGDFALKDVAYMIRNAIRPTDIAARIGGDEFMVVLTDMSWEDSLHVAERIRGNIEIVKVHRLDGSLTEVSASIGVLPINAKELKTTTSALQKVEALLKQAKLEGKNRVCAHVNALRI